jgi:hypothetical protein
VKFALCAVALFSPRFSWAQLAGNWAGVVTDAQGAHRIVLHISGPFTAMKGSADIPDQKLANVPVESITFLESTLDFSIPASEGRYSGVLNDKWRDRRHLNPAWGGSAVGVIARGSRRSDRGSAGRRSGEWALS